MILDVSCHLRPWRAVHDCAFWVLCGRPWSHRHTPLRVPHRWSPAGRSDLPTAAWDVLKTNMNTRVPYPWNAQMSFPKDNHYTVYKLTLQTKMSVQYHMIIIWSYIPKYLPPFSSTCQIYINIILAGLITLHGQAHCVIRYSPGWKATGPSTKHFQQKRWSQESSTMSEMMSRQMGHRWGSYGGCLKGILWQRAYKTL